MKKLTKAVLCLASVALLGGCAKSITVEEAAKIAGEYKVENIKETSGKCKTTVKIEGEGSYLATVKNLLEMMGIEEGESEEEIKDPKLLMITASYVAFISASTEKIEWKADGTALSYSISDSSKETVMGVTLTTEEKTNASYTSVGLPSSASSTITYKFESSTTNESFKVVANASYSYSK